MFRFFRTIRKSFIKKEKVSKYLIYALGEIILVVAGILIALQINTWNNKKIEQRQEGDILVQLKKEYEGKRKELDNKVNLRNQVIDISGKLLDIIDKKDIHISPDSIELLIGLTITTPTYDAPNSVTDELLNSGKLYLIKNDELRGLISSWKGELEVVEEEEQYVIQLLINNYVPYLIHNYPYRNFMNPLIHGNDNILKSLMSKAEILKTHALLKKSKSPISVEKVLKDSVLENFLVFMSTGNTVANMQSGPLMQHIDKTILLIENELNRF